MSEPLLCKFCGQDCFTPITPEDAIIVRAIYAAHQINVGATCPAGAAHEEQKIGVSVANYRRQQQQNQ